MINFGLLLDSVLMVKPTRTATHLKQVTTVMTLVTWFGLFFFLFFMYLALSLWITLESAFISSANLKSSSFLWTPGHCLMSLSFENVESWRRRGSIFLHRIRGPDRQIWDILLLLAIVVLFWLFAKLLRWSANRSKKHAAFFDESTSLIALIY